LHKKIKQHVLSHNAIRSTHPEGEGSGKFIPVLQMYGSTMPVKVFDMFFRKTLFNIKCSEQVYSKLYIVLPYMYTFVYIGSII
jgi:hypothetical protein